MAGHSKFKNIMFRKGAQDKKRARRFAKLSREITVATKISGGDPASNARLRTAISTARNDNMPNTNIDRTIAKALGETTETLFSEIRYEGYGVGGIAIIVETLTDNRNRTGAEVRSLFAKFGGNLGENGSVAFLFKHCGEIRFPASSASAEAIFQLAAETLAEDCTSNETEHNILCAPETLHSTADTLAQQFGDNYTAALVWQPLQNIPLVGKEAETLLKMLEALEDNEDVQNVYANFDIADETMEQLSQNAFA